MYKSFTVNRLKDKPNLTLWNNFNLRFPRYLLKNKNNYWFASKLYDSAYYMIRLLLYCNMYFMYGKEVSVKKKIIYFWSIARVLKSPTRLNVYNLIPTVFIRILLRTKINADTVKIVFRRDQLTSVEKKKYFLDYRMIDFCRYFWTRLDA